MINCTFVFFLLVAKPLTMNYNSNVCPVVCSSVFLLETVLIKNKKILPNPRHWRSGKWRPKPPKRMCYHKTQLLSVITYPLTIKINPNNTVYANVPDTLNKCLTLIVLISNASVCSSRFLSLNVPVMSSSLTIRRNIGLA